LDENAAQYHSALEILGDPKAVLRWLRSFEQRSSDIMRYDPFVHPASAAVAIVAAAKERFAGVFEDINFLEEYESKQERYRRATSGEDGPGDF
jgi:hypothetical protein